MAPIRNGALVYAKLPPPGQYPVPHEHLVYDGSDTIDLDSVQVPAGNILVKILYASLDPYMRGKMRPSETQSYTPPYEIGKPIDGAVIGLIIKSNSEKFAVGQHVAGRIEYREYVVTPTDALRVVPEVKGISWSTFIGVLGAPGATAWMGLKEHADMKKGETLFVTTAAGAVGSLVVQLGKLAGLKVIASSGSDEKVEYTKSLGADVAFNYKTESTAEILRREGPIDVYWDNVGGETLEIVLTHMNTNGRLVECGMASIYNTSSYGVKTLMNVVSRSLKIHGFIVTFLMPKYYEEFVQDMVPRVAKGEIKFKEDFVEGYENAPDGFDGLLRGKNQGKVVIKVARV